ncbi:MAG: xanthine dehydrogenase family protein [Gemmatimonadetes bacterium]|nr:xanthine dehydrogenase family protein [Gemmatimonadota bacterium]
MARARKGRRFITTTVEVEGREEVKVVEMPAFDVAPWGDDAALTIVGQRAPRVDALEKTTGRARYTADIARPGMLHAVLVRAHAAAGVATVDASVARAMRGVLDVITADEVAGQLASGGAKLFERTIRYSGQPVAAVCAETLGAARAAAAAVRVSVAPAPFVVTYDASVAPGAPSVKGSGSNLALNSPLVESRGDIAAGLAKAQVTVSLTVRTPCALHSALEPHGAVAEWEGDRLVVWESTQGVFRVRANLAAAFRLPHTHVRVLCDFMGGGFGAKNAAGPHTYAAAFLARRLQLPVRCLVDREGEQLDTGNRPASLQRITLGARRDGRLTAIRCEAEIPLGVMGWEGGPAKIYHELYSCPNVHTTEAFALVNTSAMQAFRAPGHAEGAFGLERAMDLLARKLGMDPVALRVKNFAKKDEEKQRPWSGNGLLRCYEEGARRFGWSERRAALAGGDARAAVARDARVSRGASASLAREAVVDGRRVRRGIGVAAQCWGTGGGPPAYALVRLNADGTATVLTGTQDLGTGARTVFAQVAAEALGMTLAQVRCVIGDTERLPYTGNSWGSMTTPSVAPAVRMAAEDARAQLFEAAAEMLGVAPESLSASAGTIRSSATDQTMTYAAVAKKLGEVCIIGRGSRGPNVPKTGIFSFGAQFAEVEVDVDTGVVRVLRIVAAHDCGRVLNPTLAESQLEGGILQGLGYALFEERVLDASLGLPLNPSLHDYKVPTMVDAPVIEAFCVGGADATANHVGARGLAEPPIIPTAPAIANAVADALGAEPLEIPLTPWRMLGLAPR